MDFHKLQNHFWHLDETVERFSGTETRLYFYWLNRFNKGLGGEFWPVEYPRWSKQVEADLGITDKPLAAARKVLEKRGLLYYREGSKSIAPIWSLSPIVRKNSGQYEGISRINSDEPESITPNISRNNSGQSDGLPPTLAGESPASIRSRHKPVLEQEDTNQKDGGAGGSEMSSPSLPADEEKSVPPVAEPPHPVANEMPAALVAESRALATKMAKVWQISEQKNFHKWALFAAFTKRMAELGRLDEVREQFAGYCLYRERAGLSPFRQDRYLGTLASDFVDGEWCGYDWPARAADTRPHRSEAGASAAQTPTRASVAPTTSTDWS